MPPAMHRNKTKIPTRPASGGPFGGVATPAVTGSLDPDTDWFPAKIVAAVTGGYSFVELWVDETGAVADRVAGRTNSVDDPAVTLDGATYAADDVVLVRPGPGAAWRKWEIAPAGSGGGGGEGACSGCGCGWVAGLTATDCLILTVVSGITDQTLYLSFDADTWVSADDLTVPTSTGPAELWVEGGHAHLSVGGLELVQDYCAGTSTVFSGGHATGHNSGGADGCALDVFKVRVACSECLVPMECCEGTPEPGLPTTLYFTFGSDCACVDGETVAMTFDDTSTPPVYRWYSDCFAHTCELPEYKLRVILEITCADGAWQIFVGLRHWQPDCSAVVTSGTEPLSVSYAFFDDVPCEITRPFAVTGNLTFASGGNLCGTVTSLAFTLTETAP